MERWPLSLWLAILGLILAGMAGCDSGQPPEPKPPQLAKELVFYSWAEYLPQSVIDAFAEEFGVKVIYETYDSTEAGAKSIRSGKRFDVATIDNNYLAPLARDGLIGALDFRNIQNLKNISPNFRDLVDDPGNRYSVPYNWGTTGLLVRADLSPQPITRWADAWEPRYAGKVLARPFRHELIGIALKSLGYSINSLDPAQLQAAEARLRALKPSMSFVAVEAEQATARLVNGDAVLMMGWTGDAVYASDKNPAIRYVLPEEGAILWGDSLVISAASPNRYTAELFLNFLLRPEISARIVNEYYYATANEAALAFIRPEIRDNPVVFPAKRDFDKGEWYAPITDEALKRHSEIWDRLMPEAER